METSDERTLAVAKLVDTDIDAVSRWIGETMAFSLRPWYWQRRLSINRAQTHRDLVTIGMALNAFQCDRGEYPSDLLDLVPDYLDTVPLDAHSDTPFHSDAGAAVNDDQSIDLKSMSGG